MLPLVLILRKIGLSLSARRAWIEILLCPSFMPSNRSLSARRAWIEICSVQRDSPGYWSLSARRAWIEIARKIRYVAPDVSSLSARRAWIEMLMACQAKKYSGVALRKESVDRNVWLIYFFCAVSLSLSARRAWIEIS